MQTTSPRSPSSSSQQASRTGHHPSRMSVRALCEAGLMGELPTTDPLSILLQKHLAPHLRPNRDLSGSWTTNNTPPTETRHAFSSTTPNSNPHVSPSTVPNVRHAAATNAWRKIATLSRTQLEACSSTQHRTLDDTTQSESISPEQHAWDEIHMDVVQVLQWWSVRLYSLARLKLYSMLRTELTAVWKIISTTPMLPIDTPDSVEMMVVDSDMVPFTLRVLYATEPRWRGDVRTSVERYTLLMQLCRRQVRKVEKLSGGSQREPEGMVAVWRDRWMRVGFLVAFALAEANDFMGAMDLLKPVVERALVAGEGEDVQAKARLVLVALRIWIQAGDLEYARLLLDRVSLLTSSASPASPASSASPASPDSQIAAQIEQTNALIAAIEGDFATASSILSDAHAIEAVLNCAIVGFYSAKLDDSISTLERALDAEPALIAGADAVVFNTATLYELAQGGERQVAERKRDLLAKVARWAGEPGPGASSFKL